MASVLALVAVVAGCGGSSGSDKPPVPPSARAADFPKAGSGTLGDLVKQLPKGPQLAPSQAIVDPGSPSRFGFGLFTGNGDQVADAQAALYVSSMDQKSVKGPFPARGESLAVKPQFRSRTTASDPDSARSIYVAQAAFPAAKQAIVVAIVRRGARLVATNAMSVRIGAEGPPRPGERAIKIDTPTAADVGRDLERIDTRIPPSDMHAENFADVLGRRPIVLTFATPRLCQSRVCGPVVDEILQLKAQYGDRASFIHMEIYRDNEISKGFREQVRAWNLPSEPWVFTIDRRGIVAGRVEGAASPSEYRVLIERALKS